MITKEINEIKNKGFTLPELLAALAIFSLIMGAASGLFVSTIRAQRKTLATQGLLDQTSYLAEYMSRALRMARKDINGDCTGEAKLNYKKTSSRTLEGITYSGPGIKFMNYNGICQEFFQDTADFRLKESEGNAAPIALTSDNLKVNFFNIGPDSSWDQNDDEQPRVTLFLRIKGAGESPEQQPEIEIQTTISQRNLDIKIEI